METEVRVYIVVTGQVQGVYFRYATKEEASMRGVKGWVRNRKDGSIEMVFEGEKERVKELIDFCHHGPQLAKVSSVKVIWEEYTGQFKDFSIRY